MFLKNTFWTSGEAIVRRLTRRDFNCSNRCGWSGYVRRTWTSRAMKWSSNELRPAAPVLASTEKTTEMKAASGKKEIADSYSIGPEVKASDESTPHNQCSAAESGWKRLASSRDFWFLCYSFDPLEQLRNSRSFKSVRVMESYLNGSDSSRERRIYIHRQREGRFRANNEEDWPSRQWRMYVGAGQKRERFERTWSLTWTAWNSFNERNQWTI